jgi:hypothetical protein
LFYNSEEFKYYSCNLLLILEVIFMTKRPNSKPVEGLRGPPAKDDTENRLDRSSAHSSKRDPRHAGKKKKPKN